MKSSGGWYKESRDGRSRRKKKQRRKQEKKEKSRRRGRNEKGKNNGGKKSSRRIGDMGEGGRNSEVRSGSKEIGAGKVS